jgi:hypothetical protein
LEAGFEDRVEVDDGHAQVCQVVQALLDAAQVAAEVIAAARPFQAGLGRVGIVAAVALGQVIPMLVQDLVERVTGEAVARLVNWRGRCWRLPLRKRSGKIW